MKQNILSILTLISAALLALSFKPGVTGRVGQLWSLTDVSQPYNPSKYVRFTGPVHSCPSEGKVCFIDIQASDLIPVGQPNAGQPNVVDDPFVANELADDIHTAVSNPANDPFAGSNQRVIYERN